MTNFVIYKEVASGIINAFATDDLEEANKYMAQGYMCHACKSEEVESVLEIVQTIWKEEKKYD